MILISSCLVSQNICQTREHFTVALYDCGMWMYPDVEENHEQEGSREYKGSDDIIGIRDMLIVIMVFANPKFSSGYDVCF